VQPNQQRYPIRRRIFLGLGGFVALGLLTIAGSSIIGAGRSAGVADNSARNYALLGDVGDLRVAIEDERAAVLAALASTTPGSVSRIQEAEDRVSVAERLIAAGIASNPVLTARFEAAVASIEAWDEGWRIPVTADLTAGRPVNVQLTLAPAGDGGDFLATQAAIRDLVSAAEAQETAMLDDFRASAANSAVALGIAGVLMCLGVVLVGRWIIRTVVWPLRRLNETAIAQLNGEAVVFAPERDDEIGALATVLERLRVALERRYREAHDNSTRSTTLNQLGELIAFSSEEFEVIDATVRTLQRLVPTRRGDIQLVNSSRNRLMYAGSWGDRPPALDTPVAVDRVDRCPAIRRSAPYVVPDLTDDLAVLCAAHPVEDGSLACIPLIAMGQAIGVVHLESETPITDDIVAHASRIAEQVAVAIANARLMKTMEGLAMTDGLTGLKNARFFDTYLEQELAAAVRDDEPLSILMIDIDHFKDFNDTFGHPGGDEALRVFGRVVKSATRTSDVAARYGGEEFIVALRHTDLDGAAVVADKIRLAVTAAIVELGAGRYGKFTVSVGVATADLQLIDQRGLVASADAALYRAKSSGRNRVVLSGADDRSISVREPAASTEAALAAPTSGEQVVPIGRSRRPRRAPVANRRIDPTEISA
jgi:diguanylate cyclase (GGDEF)-like protein